MKFNISNPPRGTGDPNERLDSLYSWLCMLSESLNVTLSNLGEDNLQKSFTEKLFAGKEKDNDNT